MKNLYTLNGPVSALLKEKGLLALETEVRSDVTKSIPNTNFFSNHQGYYVSILPRYAEDRNITNIFIRLIVTNIHGGEICMVEKVAGLCENKVIVLHYNLHPGRVGKLQETHMTAVDDDYVKLIDELVESAVATMSSLIRYHETKYAS